METGEGPTSSFSPPKLSERNSLLLTIGVMAALAVVSFAVVIRVFPPEDAAIQEIIDDKKVNAIEETIEGDINSDGNVDVYDLGRMGACYSDTSSYSSACDFDGNGIVDVYDLGRFVDILRLQENE